MSPRTASEVALHHPPLLALEQPVAAAVRQVLEAQLPALAVVDDRGRYAGIFGEREFLSAAFPGYLKELRGTRYLRRALDEALEIRAEAASEPVRKHMTTDHVEVGADFSDVQMAEIFLHHRVLVVPVVVDGRVDGLITRSAFFRAIAARFVDAEAP
jgi:CBS domain-containing protein